MSKEPVCRNLTSTVLYHLPQVLFIPLTFSGTPTTKSYVFKRKWKNFNQTELVLNHLGNDWRKLLELWSFSLNQKSKYCTVLLTFLIFNVKIRHLRLKNILYVNNKYRKIVCTTCDTKFYFRCQQNIEKLWTYKSYGCFTCFLVLIEVLSEI